MTPEEIEHGVSELEIAPPEETTVVDIDVDERLL